MLCTNRRWSTTSCIARSRRRALAVASADLAFHISAVAATAADAITAIMIVWVIREKLATLRPIRISVGRT